MTLKQKGRNYDHSLDELKKSLAEHATAIQELDPMLTKMVEGIDAAEKTGGKTQKEVMYDGWRVMMKFVTHQMRVNEANIRSQIALTERVDDLEKRLTHEIKEVKGLASKQAVISPTSYASILTSGASNNVNTDQPAPQPTQPHYSMVDKQAIIRKQTKEAEKCSRQVVMDVVKLAGLEDPGAHTEGEMTKIVITSLRSIDKEIDVEKDLKEFRPIEKHAEKPYLVEFTDSRAVNRLLEAAKKAKVKYRLLRPSRTREQREALRVAREQQPKDEDGNPITDNKVWDEKRRERNKGRVFFNPKPAQTSSVEQETAGASSSA